MTRIALRRPGWVCMYCGAEGLLPHGENVDTYQCPQCGEPVFPR